MILSFGRGMAIGAFVALVVGAVVDCFRPKRDAGMLEFDGEKYLRNGETAYFAVDGFTCVRGHVGPWPKCEWPNCGLVGQRAR